MAELNRFSIASSMIYNDTNLTISRYINSLDYLEKDYFSKEEKYILKEELNNKNNISKKVLNFKDCRGKTKKK